MDVKGYAVVKFPVKMDYGDLSGRKIHIFYETSNGVTKLKRGYNGPAIEGSAAGFAFEFIALSRKENAESLYGHSASSVLR